ncbi:serine acetyltransferase [uncultured Draconibacterium sp.]|uniref:serine O-acetyltransferase n=1 Tax=uncultured Draconibacterium sp. TaxID=1573823 RepID=UPI0029C89D0E|nr:serine acetyltransferase [uncultured Draconibacterium sp.]
MTYIVYLINRLRLLPHIRLFKTHKDKDIIQYDVQRWLEILNIKTDTSLGFRILMMSFPEFRNLFYHRIGTNSLWLNFLCPRMDSLYIYTKKVGPGLFIQHGFATIIAAKSIGRDCWINQQVTIGFSNETDCPLLGDNVTINAGAKIIGSLKMGNNSIAGANAVVVKDVPDDCTVVGVPAYIICRAGKKVREKL